MMVSALWYRAFGTPEAVLRMERHALSPLLPGKLRVRMLAAPINPSDLIPMTGAYRHRVVPPLVAGYEGVGRVIAAPDFPDWVGRRVLPLRASGTWQTVLDCTPDWLVPVPDEIDDVTAARAYINPLAALLMLQRFPVAGRRIVLSAARSGCARLLAAWAEADGAGAVIGIGRDVAAEARETGGREMGAVRPLIDEDDVAAIDRAVVSADLVFDAVGGNLGGRLLAGLGPDATFVTYGLLSGQPLPLRQQPPHPVRFHVRDHFDGLTPATWQGWFRQIWARDPGGLLPPAEPFAFADWRAALEQFSHRGRRTKPVLIFPDDD